MNQANVAYAKLDMSENKGWPEVERIIRKITADNGHDLQMWFFDFISTKDQIVMVNKLVDEATKLISLLCTDIKLSHIVIGASETDEDRPAREVMMGIAAKRPTRIILKELNLESGKRLLWVGGEIIE